MNDFITFARAVDAFCARMNGGLAAVAIVLALLVAGIAVIRAEQYLPVVIANVATTYQPVGDP